MNYGYIRVSAKDQNEARQLAAIEGLDIPPGNPYSDKQSGKDFQRPAYRRMLKRLRRGDVLFVLSIDRLGRNYDEILEQWCGVTKRRTKGGPLIGHPEGPTLRSFSAEK